MVDWVETKWTDWTPTVTQSGSVSATVSYARYIIIGNAAIISAKLVITGTGTAGNAISIGGQPAAIQHANSNSNTSIIGSALVLDSGVAFYHGALVSVGPTSWIITLDSQGNHLGINPSFALDNPDVVSFQAAYEV